MEPVSTKMTPDSEKPTDDPDLLRSDPAQRRKIKWLMVTMAVIALCLFLFGRPLLKRWMDVSDTALMLHRMGLVFYGLAVILFATAAYAGWYASRIFRSSQFPPPGSWVLHDTRLLRGEHARAAHGIPPVSGLTGAGVASSRVARATEGGDADGALREEAVAANYSEEEINEAIDQRVRVGKRQHFGHQRRIDRAVADEIGKYLAVQRKLPRVRLAVLQSLREQAAREGVGGKPAVEAIAVVACLQRQRIGIDVLAQAHRRRITLQQRHDGRRRDIVEANRRRVVIEQQRVVGARLACALCTHGQLLAVGIEKGERNRDRQRLFVRLSWRRRCAL